VVLHLIQVKLCYSVARISTAISIAHIGDRLDECFQ
jgi:hypothetical protein